MDGMRRRRPADADNVTVTERPTEKMTKIMKKFDMYAKVDERFTTHKGSDQGKDPFVIAAWVLIAILTLSELWNYRAAVNVPKEHMLVDTSLGQKLRININVTFPALTCAQVHIDAMDVAGDYHPYMEQTMVKQRLSRDGQLIGKTVAELANVYENKDSDLPANYCGSCYGAGDDGDCCNTCEQVVQKYSLKGWSTKDIRRDAEQCLRESTNPLLSVEEGEGCNLAGYMLVNKVAGNFHVALGESVVRDGRFIHQFQPQEAPGFNTSHTIHSITFGEPYPGMVNTLDGKQRVIGEDTGLYQYFIKLVPTIYRGRDGKAITTNQFSYTERFRALSPQVGGHHHPEDHNKHGSSPYHAQATTVLPGVFWVYDLSAFMVEISHTTVPFTHFVARLCAIAGGVFTIMGLIKSVSSHVNALSDIKKPGSGFSS